MIVWRNEMSIGVKVIDEDHKELFRIINEFEDCKTRKSAETVAKKLFSYTNSHFRREEELQIEYQYPLRDQQKEDHESIINDLRALIKSAFIDAKHTDEEIIANLSDLAHQWIVGHVIKSDMKMKSFFKTHPLRQLLDLDLPESN